MKKINVNEYLAKEDMHEYIEKLLNDLRNDPDVLEIIRGLKLTVADTRNNIAKLTDFKDDYNYCKMCPGLANCSKITRHLEARLSFNNHHIDITYSPCKKFVRELKLSSLYLYFDAPSQWKEVRLDSPDFDLHEKRNVVIDEFLKILLGKSHNWIYLFGNRGVGKSFLLTTFANEFVNRDLGSVAIIDCVKRFKELADDSYKNSDAFKKKMNDLINVDLLVFKNFGREYKNEYLRDQIVYPLLSERASTNKLCFFASDFPLNDLEVLYTLGKSAGKIIAHELISTIKSSISKEYDLSGVRLYR